MQTRIAKALESLTLTEVVDGVATDGTVNISNTLLIKSQTSLVRVELTGEGIELWVDDKLVYEL